MGGPALAPGAAGSRRVPGASGTPELVDTSRDRVVTLRGWSRHHHRAAPQRRRRPTADRERHADGSPSAADIRGHPESSRTKRRQPCSALSLRWLPRQLLRFCERCAHRQPAPTGWTARLDRWKPRRYHPIMNS